MGFNEMFKEEDKQLALSYKRSALKELEDSKRLLNAGDFTLSRIHANHGERLIEALSELNNKYRAEEIARDWF